MGCEDSSVSEEEKPKVEPEVEATSGEKLDDDEQATEQTDDIEDAEVVEDDAPEDEKELTEEPSGDDQPIVEEEKPETPAAAQPEKPRKGGFLGVVLGGLIAGGIGYGAAWYTLPKVDPAAIDAQSTEIAELRKSIETLQAFDPEALIDSTVGARTDAVQRDLTASIAEIATKLDAIDTRIAAVEALPLGGEATVASITESVQAQSDALRADLAEQEARIQSIASATADQLQQARDAAAADEAAAAEAEKAAMQRVAIARVQTALEAGTPFADALPDLESVLGVSIPAGLAAPAAEGVATLVTLQDDFPAAARAALDAARRAGVAGETGGTVGGFMSNLFNVRSVAPREGTDVDAILSRAEAAVRDGRVADAIAELDGLPEQAAAQTAAWRELAETRLAAFAALDDLVVTMNQ